MSLLKLLKFLCIFMPICFILALVLDAILFPLIQLPHITYDPNADCGNIIPPSFPFSYFRGEIGGCAYKGGEGVVKYPLFSIALHEYAHTLGYGETEAYSLSLGITFACGLIVILGMLNIMKKYVCDNVNEV